MAGKLPSAAADSPPRITVLTDFGTRDGYVGAMKAVMAEILPTAVFDDISHDVGQGAVGDASWALSRYWRRYPRGTVHLVVVDPGVGTDRRALAVAADGRFVVAPDNGVVSRVLDEARVWSAVELGAGSPPASRTFHGRDVFAPAAARLASGIPSDRLGRPVLDPARIPEPSPTLEPGSVSGEVVAVDHFGNLITNIPARLLEELAAEAMGGKPGDWRRRTTVEVGGAPIPGVSTYGEAEEGELVALVNSSDRLEIAVRNGSAARRLEAMLGLPVRVVGSGIQI